MEKFDYKSKKGNFTDCEIDYLYISTKWDGLLLVATAMAFLLRESHITAAVKPLILKLNKNTEPLLKKWPGIKMNIKKLVAPH